MTDLAGILRRHGLTLLFVAALVALFFLETRPALALRADLRRERARAERAVREEYEEARRLDLWRRGIEADELLRARALEELERAPDRRGPVILPPPLPADGDDASAADGAR